MRLRYDGADDHRRTTTIAFEPRPAHLDGGRARFPLTLQPGESTVITVTITIADQPMENSPVGPVTRALEISPARRPVSRSGDAPSGTGLLGARCSSR